MKDYVVSGETADKVFHLMIWYGFFGVVLGSSEARYIYHVNYKMPLTEGLIKKGDDLMFYINQGFRPCLMTSDP
jgi:hypothetical protein